MGHLSRQAEQLFEGGTTLFIPLLPETREATQKL